MSDQQLAWTPPPPGGVTTATAAVSRAGTPRLDYIDLLRGLVIVLMVLDHVREYFSLEALQFNPTDLSATTPAFFAARWVTHLCAPTFVFLAGASAFLQRNANPDRAAVARFLFTRGLWLIFLEAVVISFGFNFAHPFLFLQVIWAIGFGMILLAALLWLPPWTVAIVGVVILAGHGLMPRPDIKTLGALGPIQMALLGPPGLPGGPWGLFVYPAIPWFGIMCLGYGAGVVFTLPDRARRAAILALGVATLVAFAVLRGLNGFGDPRPWTVQKDQLFTALSFINVTKQPPSPDYVLVTLGVSLLLGLWLENWKGFFERLLLAFGRTPLFTYLLHVYLIHGLAVLVGMMRGVPANAFFSFLLEGPDKLIAAKWGFHLSGVLFFWVLVVLILYPVSSAYMKARQQNRQPWMSYL